MKALKKLINGPVGDVVKGLVREGLQTLPVVGTVVTNWKTAEKGNPKGQIKLGKWDVYRLVIGLGVAYVLIKGLLTMKEIKFVLELITF